MNIGVALLATNLPGLVVGFLIGRRVPRATVKIEESMDENLPPAPPKQRALLIIASVVALIGVGTVALGIIVMRYVAVDDARDHQFAACVAGYSNALGDALKARLAANQAVTDQMDLFMNAVVQAFDNATPETREALIAAARAYVKQRLEAQAELQDNPLPEVPRDACAELDE